MTTTTTSSIETRVVIGKLSFECPVPRTGNHQTVRTFDEAQHYAANNQGRLPLLCEYFAVFTHESGDQQVTRLATDIHEQPLEWAGDAWERTGSLLYHIKQPTVRAGQIVSPVSIGKPHVTLPLGNSRTVFSLDELGFSFAREFLGLTFSEIPFEVRNGTIVTIPGNNSTGLIRVGRAAGTKLAYHITSILPSVQGVARCVQDYDPH